MDFEKIVPEWKAEGTEPPASLKESGFEAGQKPPAAYFNWFWNRVGECLKEIREKLSGHANNKENPHSVTAAQIGLDKVNNTPDAEKNVAFSSEAAAARKVNNKLTIRFNGGSTEGTSMFTYDGSTGKSANITPAGIGAAKSDHTHTPSAIGAAAASHTHGMTDLTGTLPVNKGGTGSTTAAAARTALGVTPANIGAAKTDLSNVDNSVLKSKASGAGIGIPIVEAASSDGIAYTATVDGVTELYNGLIITIIPKVVSASTAITLNVNGLGAKMVRLPLSFNNAAMNAPKLETYFTAGRPITLQYDAAYLANDGIWKTLGKQKTSAQDLYGTVPIESGGTGADTAEKALANLKALPLAGGTLTGWLTGPRFTVQSTDGYPAVAYNNADGNQVGALHFNAGTHRFYVAQKATDTNYNESYILPTVATGLTGSKTYNFLTTKAPVTVAQGGTGATTAAAARTALGITPVNIGALPLEGGTLTGDVIIAESYPYLRLATPDGDPVAALYGSVNEHKTYLCTFSKGTGYYEGYGLPTADSGLTAHKWYKLLTSKEAVTIAQGGTGATTAAAARSNLGITLANLGDVVVSETTPTSVTNGKWYLVKQG